MTKMKIKYNYKILFLLLTVAFIAFGFLGDDKNGIKTPRSIYKITSSQESGKQGDAYGMNVNNIWLPINRRGIIADVNIEPNGSGGQFAGGTFLFSSGFFLSGLSNGALWANAAASASLVEDYVQGVVGGENDPNAVVYVVNSKDEPFGVSWQDWVDAVSLGADFVDGDGDGQYNPVDKNNNGAYDPDEDMPDLIGDETVWCVYHDGLPVAQRRWNTTIEVGMEVRQTVFAFASAGAIGNIIFVRYRITYVGTDPSSPDELTDVYFGAWADPDLGDFNDDVIGVDVGRNAGFTYNNTPDAVYGNQVPCFMIDFFSGPREYIPGETFIDNNGNGIFDEGDTPLDTAFSVQGQMKGIQEFLGARNLPISSFVMYINGDPDLRDPDNKEEARNYCLGTNRVGDIPDPCTFAYGEVRGGVDCSTVDPRFWFSGDPVAGSNGVGWICTENQDMRQMTNTGPFTLKKGEENEIVLAYVVGRGSTPLDGITVARSIDDGAQNIFDLNFLAPTPPPAPQVTLSSSDDFIDIIWETPSQVNYLSQTPTWDLRFEGYQVWAYRTNIPEDIVAGEENSALVTTYDLANFVQNIYKENSETLGIELLYNVSSEENQLDFETFSDPVTGRIRLRLFNDPFSPNEGVTKGRPYYFAVTSYALNYDALVYKDDPSQPIGTEGDYYLNSFAFAQEAENIKTIRTIIVGSSALNPPVPVQPSNKISGASLGNVGYDVVDNEALTGDMYEVTFTKNIESVEYSTYWNLTNLSTGQVWDSSQAYTYGEQTVNQEITDGFIMRVENQIPTIGSPEYIGTQWFTDFYDETDPNSVDDGTGVTYLGRDIPQGRVVLTFPGRCEIIGADRLRRIELRFDTPGKAYRYINGYLSVFALNTYRYAPGLTPQDTVGKGPIGNWDNTNDRPNGWVDVPFTAWMVDENFGTEQQLAVGFVERSRNSTYPGGNPDGVWDPGTDFLASGEIILIFDYPYDPNGGDDPYDPNSGGQIQYTGGAFSTPGGVQFVWADLTKTSASAKDAPEDATNITEEQRAIFNSRWFNTLYAVGFQRSDETSFYTEGDRLIIPVSVYPYTENDVYQFQTLEGTTLTAEDERSLWDKVNVYPNPLFGYNTLSNYYSNTPDEPFVTFTNLPEEITVKIYSLSGTLLRTLTKEDKDTPTSPYLRWDLENESELRVASGMYLAIVSSPKFGDKVLKFAIIMPQKQIQRF